MRLSAVGFLMILTTIFLSGCGSQQVASVDDKGASYYGRHQTVMLPANRTPGSYIPLNTQQDAAISSVETRDLSSPAATTTGKPATKTASNGKSPFMTVAESNARYPAQTSAASGSWQWPTDGKVIQNFGSQRNGTASEGITIAAAEGDPIRAAQAGEVAYVGNNIRDYGNIAILRHGDGTLSSYSHARTITVAKGQKVDAGSVIGFVGHSGSAKSPQLHFAVREGSKAVDPMGKLPQNVASN